MDVKPLVKAVLARNREVMESTMADVGNEHAEWAPPGKALPLGALYVHVLTSEDFFIQGLLKGGTPMWDSSWKGSKMGLSEPRPPLGQPGELGASVRIDMRSCASYAKGSSWPRTPTRQPERGRPRQGGRVLRSQDAGGGFVAWPDVHPHCEPHRRDLHSEGTAGTEGLSYLTSLVLR